MEKAKRTVLVRSKYAPAEAEHHTAKTTNPLFPSKKVILMRTSSIFKRQDVSLTTERVLFCVRITANPNASHFAKPGDVRWDNI